MLRKGGSFSSDSKVFLVTSAAQTEQLVTYIQEMKAQDSSKDIILGMDWEGLNVTKSLSLLQVRLPS